MLGRVAAVVLVVASFTAAVPADGPSPQASEIKRAVSQALPLIEKGAAGYVRERQCFSCHHQALPVLAMTTARARGFAVSQEGLDKQLQHTADFLAKNRENYLKGKGTGGQADTAGYGLWTLEMGDRKPDATTAAVAEYLLLWQKDLEHWRVTSKRPPSETSHFTTTYLALRALRTFGTPEQKERIEARTDQVRTWLLKTPGRDTEDRVFRFWALKVAQAQEKDLASAREELLKSQRQDGGWGQTDDMASDAYATGTALVSLHQAGGLPVSDLAYRRGLKFLLGKQLKDGSWLVQSRSKPFQTYFESGFPHGKDQFISLAASGWATAALALACPAGNR